MTTESARSIARKQAKSMAKKVFKNLSEPNKLPNTHGVTGLSGFLAFLLVFVLPTLHFTLDMESSFLYPLVSNINSDSIISVMPLMLLGSAAYILVWYILFVEIYTFDYSHGRRGFSNPIDDSCRSFYLACKEIGITKPLTPVTKEKMKRLAVAQGFAGNAEELFERGYEITEEDKQKELDVIKEKERKAKEELEQFVGLTGTEKRKSMILATMPKEKKYQGTANSFYKKESDWAVAGGIASGLAGGAAGVATALDVQAKNAKVRSYNQSVSGLVNTLNNMEYSSVKQNNERRASLMKRLELLPTLLTETVPDQTALMKKIETKCKVEASKTGSVTVQVSMRLKEPVKIMNEANAVVDGYLNAIITDKSGHSDTVPVTLPMLGVSNYFSTAKAMSTCFTDPDAANYTVRLEPNNLWLIEP